MDLDSVLCSLRHYHNFLIIRVSKGAYGSLGSLGVPLGDQSLADAGQASRSVPCSAQPSSEKLPLLQQMETYRVAQPDNMKGMRDLGIIISKLGNLHFKKMRKNVRV